MTETERLKYIEQQQYGFRKIWFRFCRGLGLCPRWLIHIWDYQGNGWTVRQCKKCGRTQKWRDADMILDPCGWYDI